MPFDNDREDRIEGRNAVIEALRAGRSIDKIYIAIPSASIEAKREITNMILVTDAGPVDLTEAPKELLILE